MVFTDYFQYMLHKCKYPKLNGLVVYTDLCLKG